MSFKSHIKVKKIVLACITMLVISSVLFATDAIAAENRNMFGGLTSAGSRIFSGMRDIIYAVSGFGVVGIAIAGFFGNLNWKWLSAIIIGLMVIALTAGILNYMTGDEFKDSITITNTLINAD